MHLFTPPLIFLALLALFPLEAFPSPLPPPTLSALLCLMTRDSPFLFFLSFIRWFICYSILFYSFIFFGITCTNVQCLFYIHSLSLQPAMATRYKNLGNQTKNIHISRGRPLLSFGTLGVTDLGIGAHALGFLVWRWMHME